MFELLFACDCICWVIKTFKVKQIPQMILPCEPSDRALFVFVNPTNQIVCDTNIQCWVLIAHDVNVITLIHNTDPRFREDDGLITPA